MKMSDDWLDKIVKCPNCKEDVKNGDMIWLDGECLCPQCYEYKRAKYDALVQKGYDMENKK